MDARENFWISASKLEVPSSRHDVFGRTLPLLVCREPHLQVLDPPNPAHLLGFIRYGQAFERGRAANPAECGIPLRCLDSSSVGFAWFGRTEASSGHSGDIVYRCDGETLFGTFRDRSVGPQTIEESAYSAYLAMLNTAAEAGYPYVYRIWNYLPEINSEIDGLEVYKAFCIGRQRAFDRFPTPSDSAVPAACAIGTKVSGFYLYFLGSKHAVQPLSNPRQVEAYRYPAQYGPSSPAFSRAVLVWQGTSAAQFHISGTASIVGHATRHFGDIDAQLTETLTNLGALLRRVGLAYADLGGNAQFTIYLRRASDLERVEKVLRTVLAPDVIRVFLQGDICRSSLLLEIEGIISLDAGTLPDVLRSGCN